MEIRRTTSSIPWRCESKECSEFTVKLSQNMHCQKHKCTIATGHACNFSCRKCPTSPKKIDIHAICQLHTDHQLPNSPNTGSAKPCGNCQTDRLTHKA
eukprot:1158308-Pelagomonas_calceolata.AAC.14